MSLDCILLLVAAAAALGLAAFAVFRRQPERSFAKTAFALGMAMLGVESILAAIGAYSLLPPEVLVWQRWRLLALALLPGCWLAFSLTYARGNEKDFLRRWRTGLAAALVLPVGLVAATWNSLLTGAVESGPDGMQLVILGQSGIWLHIIFVGGAILCLMNLERTLRISTGTMRWRIKYMIIGLGILFAVRCYTSTQTILYSAVNMDLASLRAGALIVGCMFACLSLVRGSFAAVDLYPSHGVLYGSVTMLLAGAYLMVVGVFAEVVAYFGWGQSFPLAAFLVLVSLVGVTIILLSDRLRQRIKRFVSRHFHRPQYDYRRVWSMFSERTVALTDAGDFCRAVTRVISETFDLLSVTIWLVDEAGRRYVLGGSTALAEAEAKKLIGTGKVSGDILRLLREHAYPTPVEGISGEFGSFLRQLGHKEFEHGGEYFFLPLTTSEEVLGILVLGDRVSGLPFTIEEIDLLKTIGNQTVANLLSIKLSGRLVEAQKLEAFQTMSAFFVHDLKNTASTLSLMLQNLPRHFDDPAFRQDALRAISKSVDKINGLIGRLTFFRQKIEIKPLAGDLNQVVKSTLAGLAGFDGERLTTELRPLPAVLMDAEQIQKVITNLLLNARDASAETGRIELQTLRSDGWVVLTVSDRGCGMSPEFIEQSLFRPFQTTKQDGIGIGLFHSKMIVEAHRGRIDVESRPGEGSTFRVFLPVQGVTR